MRSCASIIVVGLLSWSGEALAQEACEAAGCPGGRNECTTLVLHARESDAPLCDDAIDEDGVDCADVRPTVTLTETGTYAITVFMRNFDDVAGVQAAFEWPEEWELLSTNFSCRSRVLCAVTPTESGARSGSFACAWDLDESGDLQPIGVMVFEIDEPGCLTMVSSDFPFGNHLIDGDNDSTSIDEANWGKVCLGTPGVDRCDCVVNCGQDEAVDGDVCDDNDVCTQTDECASGVCTGSDPLTCEADQCHEAGDCDPSLGCSSTAVEDDTGCDDENACTEEDACQSGVCIGGEVECDSPTQCQSEVTCDPASGCVAVDHDDGFACDDGDACTTIDACQAGACVGAEPLVCEEADECHEPAVCGAETGDCGSAALPDGTPCADGLCVDGACVPDAEPEEGESTEEETSDDDTGAPGTAEAQAPLDGGCSCRASGTAPTNAAVLFFVLAGVTWRSRRGNGRCRTRETSVSRGTSEGAAGEI